MRDRERNVVSVVDRESIAEEVLKKRDRKIEDKKTESAKKEKQRKRKTDRERERQTEKEKDKEAMRQRKRGIAREAEYES